MRTFTRSNGLPGEHAMMDRVEGEIQQLVDRESEAWNSRDAEALVEILHPDMILPWPPDAQSHDPATWVMPMGRYNRQRWKEGWEELFRSYELIHNERKIVRIMVSAEGDGAFAVVDVDTLWRHRANGADFHWKGRACKGYTKVNDRWLLIFQTGLLNYDQSPASLEELLATVARMEARWAALQEPALKELWRIYLELGPRFERDLGSSARDVALAKASALMVLQGAAHAKTSG